MDNISQNNDTQIIFSIDDYLNTENENFTYFAKKYNKYTIQLGDLFELNSFMKIGKFLKNQ